MSASLSSSPLLDPVLTAIIAGAVGFLVSVLSKEHKTSEFRQAWIDTLRNDLAELVSLSGLLQDILAVAIRQGKSVSELSASLGEKHQEFERMEAAAARIRLRLNPQEHQALIGAVQQLLEPNPELREGDASGSDSLQERVIRESQRVLKAEWQRVKRGEPIFVATKWISLVLLVGAGSLAAALFSGKVALTYVP